MIKLRIITGLLTMPLFITTAHAVGDLTCDTLDGLAPVSSHYVQEVLDRADEGLEYAREGGVADDFSAILPNWALSVGSAWAGLTDTGIQRVQEGSELRDVSACLHLDLSLIDCKIEEVRQELRTQLQRGSFIAIVRLTPLLEFLNERRRQLRIGALDPEYVDNGWGRLMAFDRPDTVWCGGGSGGVTCTEEDNEDACAVSGGTSFETLDNCIQGNFLPPDPLPQDTDIMCPFDADYAPAFDSGFGCDIETMQPREVYPPIADELEALNAVNDELRTYRQAATELLQLQQQIDELFGTKNPLPPPPPPRKHLDAFSCGWMGGYCDSNSDKRCTKTSECPKEDLDGDGKLDVVECIFPNKLCDKNRAIRCKDDDQCKTDPDDRCVDASEANLRATRGVFSVDEDQMAILTSFLGVRSVQEGARLFKEDLRTAAEIPENEPDLREIKARQDTDPLFKLVRGSLRTAVSAWSAMQSRLEVIIYPEAVDSSLEVTSALSNLHEAVSEFSRLAAEKQGVRDFVIRYGAFLQRSCVTRICGMMLKQAISIATTDECFPYANGQYLSDTEDKPRWEKCKDAAEIE